LGAGPTGVVLTQQGPWTIRLLVNHICQKATLRNIYQ
jgi:hypothetical protein